MVIIVINTYYIHYKVLRVYTIIFLTEKLFIVGLAKAQFMKTAMDLQKVQDPSSAFLLLYYNGIWMNLMFLLNLDPCMFFMINPTKINHKLKMKNISIQGRHKQNTAAMITKYLG
jgi:hypothetical protein